MASSNPCFYRLCFLVLEVTDYLNEKKVLIISKIKFSAKNLSKFLITVQDKEEAIIWFLLYLFVHLDKNDNSNKEKY